MFGRPPEIPPGGAATQFDYGLRPLLVNPQNLLRAFRGTPRGIGTKNKKKLKKLNDTFSKSGQRRTVPEGTVRSLVVVIVPIERHDEHILLRR